MPVAKRITIIGFVLVGMELGAGLAWSAPSKNEALAGAPSPVVVVDDAGPVGGGGYRTEIFQGTRPLPVVVVGGTPYQMGYHLGCLMRAEIRQFMPVAVARMKVKMHVSNATLRVVWSTTAAYTDDRVEQELLGVARGSGVPLATLHEAHCLPLLMPCSCSSIAAWGKATADGDLYQTRDLDWTLSVKVQDFPVLVVYLPLHGYAHVLPTFAGMVGANTGMNVKGIVLAEMGDSPARDMPYNLRAPHFTTYFRTILYDAGSLTQALDIFRNLPQTKRYHFVFGDGRTEHRAVKIRTDSRKPAPLNIQIWHDNDPKDEFAPNVLPCVVYDDEGRGAFPMIKHEYGRLDAQKMIALADQIAIHGANLLDVVYDATALRLWVSYAHGQKEAYRLPYAALDLNKLDGNHDGTPDIVEGAAVAHGKTVPAFLSPSVRSP